MKCYINTESGAKITCDKFHPMSVILTSEVGVMKKAINTKLFP